MFFASSLNPLNDRTWCNVTALFQIPTGDDRPKPHWRHSEQLGGQWILCTHEIGTFTKLNKAHMPFDTKLISLQRFLPKNVCCNSNSGDSIFVFVFLLCIARRLKQCIHIIIATECRRPIVCSGMYLPLQPLLLRLFLLFSLFLCTTWSYTESNGAETVCDCDDTQWSFMLILFSFFFSLELFTEQQCVCVLTHSPFTYFHRWLSIWTNSK